MVSTVSLAVKKQLEDKWAAAFYECGIPLEVASSQALCDAAEDTARLVCMPDNRFALVLTGFGAGKVGARRLHEPKPETDLVAISSTMRTRASKSASKVRCTYSLSWHAGTLVSDGRKRCAKRPMWNCLVHTSMGVFLIEICDTSWRRTRMPGGATGARYTISLLVSQASRSPSAQQSDVGRRTRHSLSKAEPPWAGAGSETGPSAL